MNKITYIILVNWNGWADTIECLESVFRLEKCNYRVIVCDNGSRDDSLSHIERWAQGELVSTAAEACMACYSQPPVTKPLEYLVLTRNEAEQCEKQLNAPLILVDCEDNLGFAGGNNVGIRLALSQQNMAWAWLLNNDTVVDKNALNTLLLKAQQSSKCGMVGSTLVYYHEPSKVQAFGGGRFFFFFGIAMHVGRFRNRLRKINEQRIQRQLSYIMGASMLAAREFIERIGLMSEEYFLYYEELDWALRARNLFNLCYAQDSLVFHKAGASIGSSNKSASRSMLSDYYLMRNRLKITKRFFPRYLIFVRSFLFIDALVRLFQGKKIQAKRNWYLAMGQENRVQVPRRQQP